MTHIFMDESDGVSGQSLSDAVANAIQSAFKHNIKGGGHKFSLTVIIDGWSFDGKRYRVHLRVAMFDHDLAHEDIYHEIEKERARREQLNRDMANHLYAAIYHKHSFRSSHDEFAEKLRDVLDIAHEGPEYLTVVTDSKTHDHLMREVGYSPERKPVYPRAHTDLGEPSLGPGGGYGPGEDRAA